MSGSWTTWLIIAILGVYMVYSIYKSLTIFKKHKETLKEFKAKNPNAQLFDTSKGWVISSTIMCIICLLLAFSMSSMESDSSKVLSYQIVYIIIAVVFAGMILSSFAGKRMWFTDEGFFFGDRFFKYKEVDHKEPIGGVGSNTLRLVMKNNYAIQINKKMDDKIQDQIKLWKAKRKK